MWTCNTRTPRIKRGATQGEQSHLEGSNADGNNWTLDLGMEQPTDERRFNCSIASWIFALYRIQKFGSLRRESGSQNKIESYWRRCHHVKNYPIIRAYVNCALLRAAPLGRPDSDPLRLWDLRRLLTIYPKARHARQLCLLCLLLKRSVFPLLFSLSVFLNSFLEYWSNGHRSDRKSIRVRTASVVVFFILFDATLTDRPVD